MILATKAVKALLELDQGLSLREKRRARHRANGFMIEGGRLWKLADGKCVRSRPRTECVTKKEAEELAWKVHRDGGHFMRDNVKAILLDKIFSPGLERSI
ncbi:hypothetical protein CPC08DRAFT_648892, partial [Agrocybe pediades]